MLDNISDKLAAALIAVDKKLDEVQSILDATLGSKDTFIDDKGADILELQLKVLLRTRHNQGLLDTALSVNKVREKESKEPRVQWRDVFLNGDAESAAQIMVDFINDRSFSIASAKRVLTRYQECPF